MVGSFIFKEETTMEKVKIEDSKLAGYIHDELINRGYKIAAFDVYTGYMERYEYCSFIFDIDENTYIDVTIEEKSSISAGDSENELHYAYSLNHVCDNFPAMLKLRKGDLLEVADDPRDNESPLKILFHREDEHADIFDHEVDRNTVTNLIDKILIELGLKDFVE